jgi:hypothetical protein
VSVAALPYVNWIFWAALSSGSLLVVGLTEALGGTTRGYRLFMAGFAAVCVAILVLSELNLPGDVPAAATEAVRRPLVLAFAALTLLYVVASVARWPRSGLAVVAALAGLAALVVLAVAGPSGNQVLFGAQLVLAALCLGSVNAAMLLGHWYLVTPRLSPLPLRRIMWFAVGALALQAVAFVIAFLAVPRVDLVNGLAWLALMRLVIGILLPIGIAVLAILASRAASLQAATGLLYIGLALVMAGSIAGASITYLTGVPV